MKAKKEQFDVKTKKTPQPIDLHWEFHEFGPHEVGKYWTLHVSLPPDRTRSEPLALVKEKKIRWHWRRYGVVKIQGQCKKSGKSASRKDAMKAAMRALDRWLEQLRNQEATFPKPPGQNSPPQQPRSDSDKKKSPRSNSDKGFTMGYSKVISVEKQANLHYLLGGTEPSSVKRFVNAVQYWLRTLRRRSQRAFISWDRFNQLTACFFPKIRLLHPHPCHRFDVRTRGRSPVR